MKENLQGYVIALADIHNVRSDMQICENMNFIVRSHFGYQDKQWKAAEPWYYQYVLTIVRLCSLWYLSQEGRKCGYRPLTVLMMRKASIANVFGRVKRPPVDVSSFSLA